MPAQPFPNASAAPPLTGLVLTGGGARAAYQVGVLQAISDLRRQCEPNNHANPFPVMTGTSAGAINAAALACGADQFDRSVRRLARVWSHFHPHNVYRSDSISMLRSGASWLSLLSLGWVVARWHRLRPRSLLDNGPLLQLLQQLVPLIRLPLLMRQGHLHALAITASSYSSGEHITFFEAGDRLVPWVRTQRRSIRDEIRHEHLLASSAIPFIFPAQGIDIDGATEYFGDGSMRQSAPIAPAIHLGAERILVIGAGRMHESGSDPTAAPSSGYPSLAQIAGHALSNIFLDALWVDVERMQRINKTLSLIPEQARTNSALKPLELLVIAPSQRLDAIATRHVDRLPVPLRTLLGTIGVSSKEQEVRSAALASYLLFEEHYTQELMALGRADVAARRDEVLAFFGWHLPLDRSGAPSQAQPDHLGMPPPDE